ncbi:glutaredoxin-like protein NrdH [Lacticaseibacillus pabuli]|uniref:Glutaredoxin-like protein NrdH n=1 Tax=Lacticaseibacillus pabuli TaxID=3025672 RepID=A0ABY7WRA5_9LACO|nr:glutaredoxin-like protein NrdH [Lacticaseibacillus sp. KACC 23028]WDF81893.1 glutaredoxin-like protein NrdH [Lacticaseibacillus sp. KACC 23028]
MKNVTLFTKNGCPQCRMTRNYLSSHNIPFTEHNINNEPECVDYLKGQGFKAVPVVEADGMAAWFGFRPDALAKLQ